MQQHFQLLLNPMPMELPNTNSTNQTSSFQSSPSHDFSFNNHISLNSTPATSTAIDLTPADDIFFHGHLLPLHHHHLHSLPVSARSSSANSIEASALPIPIISDQPNHTNNKGCICIRCDHHRTRGHSFNSYEYYSSTRTRTILQEAKTESNPVRAKAKSFSLFGTARRRKEAQDHGGNRKKAGFDAMPHFLRKYVKMFSKGKTEELHFSTSRQGCRAQFSPANSGVISNNDSTMEELQAAIQAAIAHCKDSISS